MERPTGAGQRAGGWVLMVVGGIAFLLSLDGSGIGVDGVMRQWTLLILSASAFGLAIMLFAVGWILRAIWFLPGREIEADVSDGASAEPRAEAEETNSRALTAVLICGIVVMVAIIAWSQAGTP